MPGHLRTCQCQEDACRWHRRHHGCAGPVTLVLSGGRSWRLADTCLACASATDHAVVVPSTALATPPPARPRPSGSWRRRTHGEDERLRVRRALNYLACVLGTGVGCGARLLAVQCALRCSPGGRVRLPPGLLRGMRLAPVHRHWQELENQGWLRLRSPGRAAPCDAWHAQLLDGGLLARSVSRRDGNRAADWAAPHDLQPSSAPMGTRATAGRAGHVGSCPARRHWWCPGERRVGPPHRACQRRRSPRGALTLSGFLASWRFGPTTGDVHWTLGSAKGVVPLERSAPPRDAEQP